MTNKEKAKEISSKYICDNQVMHYDHGDVIYEYETFGEETEDAALEMAEWKDQQFKEYLEKKLVDIRKEKMCGPHGVGCNQGAQRVVNEIINELFGPSTE